MQHRNMDTGSASIRHKYRKERLPALQQMGLILRNVLIGNPRSHGFYVRSSLSHKPSELVLLKDVNMGRVRESIATV
jgi:hypothetical protein